ncbi:unnamed protein product [Nesidiocoris tenuis]|uniref:Uncharacterized protein n=1 Tax=Nesidiocoris tenuis TaxID=355587 RepID=A0A6H5HPV4_9HEMI|nr:unnamed protein product [Nesidiocoris tenuis]
MKLYKRCHNVLIEQGYLGLLLSQSRTIRIGKPSSFQVPPQLWGHVEIAPKKMPFRLHRSTMRSRRGASVGGQQLKLKLNVKLKLKLKYFRVKLKPLNWARPRHPPGTTPLLNCRCSIRHTSAHNPVITFFSSKVRNKGTATMLPAQGLPRCRVIVLRSRNGEGRQTSVLSEEFFPSKGNTLWSSNEADWARAIMVFFSIALSTSLRLLILITEVTRLPPDSHPTMRITCSLATLKRSADDHPFSWKAGATDRNLPVVRHPLRPRRPLDLSAA